MSRLTPIAITVCLTISSLARGQTQPATSPDLTTPEQIIAYLVDQPGWGPHYDQMYDRIRSNPERFAPLIARRMALPEDPDKVDDAALFATYRASLLIQMLGVKQGMPLAIELYVSATRLRRLAFPEWQAARREMEKDKSVTTRPARVLILDRYCGFLNMLRDSALNQLIVFKSPALVDYILTQFETDDTPLELGGKISQYFDAAKATDALITVYRIAPRGSSARNAAKYALEHTALSESQKKAVDQINPVGAD